MRIFLTALSILLAGMGAAKAQWSEFRSIPLSEVPITVALKGWEGDDWRLAAFQREFKSLDSSSCYSEHFYTNFKKGNYWGTLSFRDTRADCSFRDTTVRASVGGIARFRGTQIEFGAYGTVDNGPAEYRHLMFTSEKDGTRTECMGFDGAWRNIYSQGYLCSSSGPLTEAAGKTFLRAVDFKKKMAPVAGSLE